jgi:hypothetical protein
VVVFPERYLPVADLAIAKTTGFRQRSFRSTIRATTFFRKIHA